MSTVVSLATGAADPRYDTAEDILVRALDRVQNGYPDDPNFRPTGAVVILLDETGGEYRIYREVSKLKTNELIALLDIVKHQELKLTLEAL